MKFEVIVVLVVAAIIYDAYYCGGKYMKWVQSIRRYYKTFMYVAGAIFLYLLVKSGDPRSTGVLYHGYNLIKQLPLERSYVNSLSPIFDFTGNDGDDAGIMEGMNTTIPLMPSQTPSRRGNGTRVGLATKRSVSEAKKRYVAASQNWMCANCQQTLNHTFEVDHITRLEFGGSNDVSNLSALCRNCHGIKTARENIAKSDM